ncbi:hypothetical protein ILUMI_11029 [Ignelater luminosus]|uniref:HTH psq-type domain-containing protein n=1 Tax=Ignelater luminosus TaxID=2038154 RepID=A0A8K0CWT6_IGNLU|nr:hypothetical protein ILUMI_11029 [Ignelater luminosus]
MEDNITQALDAINHGMSKRKAAAVFNILRSTLQFRLSENFVKSKHGPNHTLFFAEENTLVDWILECQEKKNRYSDMPYVITSSGYKNLFNKQQEVKEKAELEKLERKQKRIENKESKLLTQKEKKPRKRMSEVNVISNVILPTSKNSLGSEKTKQQENHVRRLFEDDSNTSLMVAQKSETNGI